MMHHNPHVKNMEILNDEKKKEDLEKTCDLVNDTLNEFLLNKLKERAKNGEH